jgi:hypothetical protein
MVTVALAASSIMADDVGAADDHGMLAAQVLHADGLQHLHAAIGRAGLEADFAHHQRARAGHMETVHVLERRDGLDDLVVVDVGGQRQLDQDAVDAGVVVQRLDAGRPGPRPGRAWCHGP